MACRSDFIRAPLPARLPLPAASLALGCFQVFAPYLVPAIVARMSKLEPSISVTLLEADQGKLLAGLRRGEIEVALLYDFGLGEGLRAERLAELVPYVLLPDGHPLGNQSALTLEALGVGAFGAARSRAQQRLFSVVVPRSRPGAESRLSQRILGDGARLCRARARLQSARDQTREQHVL